MPSTPCCAPDQKIPRPGQRTCNGRPLPRHRSNSHTAATNTCSMQPPCPKPTKPTSSKFCSTNRENLPHDIPPKTAPPPRLHTIHQGQQQHGTHDHHRYRTHTHQHARATSSHSSTPPSVHRYRQPPASACPLCVRQRLTQTALPCNPDHWVCLGAAHRLTHCTHCGDINPHHRTRPAAPAAPPLPRQSPRLLQATHSSPPGPPGRILRGGRNRPHVDHSHGHGQHVPAPPTAPPCARAGAA